VVQAVMPTTNSVAESTDHHRLRTVAPF
jgi:hypothetical protein